MTQDEHDYYNSRSKLESQSMAAWCFIAVLILSVLGAIHGIKERRSVFLNGRGN